MAVLGLGLNFLFPIFCGGRGNWLKTFPSSSNYLKEFRRGRGSVQGRGIRAVPQELG